MLLTILFALHAHSSEIWLRVGETRTLPAPAEAKVRIGARGVIRAIDSEDGLKVIGLKPGATTLAIDSESHLVRVSFSSQKKFLIELRAALKEMMGLTLQTDEKQIQVRGTLLRFSDWQELADIAARHQGEYEFRARALTDVAEEALAHLSKTAAERGLPVVRFSANGQFAAHIPRSASGLKPAVTRAFAPYGIAIELTDSDLALAPLVRTRVILAEVSKTFSRQLGVEWPTEYSAQLLPRAAPGQDTLVAKLKALESKGQAQILASPTLLCRSGGSAQFHAGGEFPIRSVSRHSAHVNWKTHGVILNVKPVADFQGAMSVEVETEVSLLDMGNAVDGVPALKKNRVKSHFDLPGKRTIALSGLLRQELGRSRDGLPLLSSLPVLGALFSSKAYLSHESELVVFVTPEVHSPIADERIEMPAGWVQRGF